MKPADGLYFRKSNSFVARVREREKQNGYKYSDINRALSIVDPFNYHLSEYTFVAPETFIEWSE